MEKEVSTSDDRDHRIGGTGVQLREGQLSGRESRYRLLSGIELFPASTGDLHLLRPGEAGDLVVRRPDPLARALIAALAARAATLDDLAGACGAKRDDIAPKLDALARAGVLETVEGELVELPAQLAARFDRQLPYLAGFGDPGAVQLRLRASTVAVLGCGGLGTWALGALAGTGVGGFVLVDDDVVEPSNLNRQVLYGAADVGQAKVERAAAWLHAFDPDVHVVTQRRRVAGPDDVASAIADADLLVQTADTPPYALVRWVDTACRSLGIPFILGGQRPPIVRIGPTIVPGETACFACREASLREQFPYYDELSAQRDERPGRSTTLGPASGIAGTLVALEALHRLVGSTAATEGRALLLDMRTLATRWESWERRPDCPACHHLGGDS
jgi:bacteriocin biosynthesis cyclodehydratase domain-containing protein